MRKLTYKIIEETKTYHLEFITNRTQQWTEQQYLRHRGNVIMELISDEETEEQEGLSREVELG